MEIEDQLRERLRKVEALYFGATSAGEREAAGAAAERLKAARRSVPARPSRRDEVQPAGRMVGAIVYRACRRYGFRPFRYARQRRTTIMVRAPRRFFDAVAWRQFSDVHTDLWVHFQQTTEKLIKDAICADTRDAETTAEPSLLG